MTDKKLGTLTLVVEIDDLTADVLDGNVGVLRVSGRTFEGIVRVHPGVIEDPQVVITRYLVPGSASVAPRKGSYGSATGANDLVDPRQG